MDSILNKTQSIIFLLFGFIYLVIFFIPLCFLMGLFKLNTKLSFIGPAWGLFCRVLIKFGLRSELNIIDRRDQLERSKTVVSSLYIANHQSLMDIPLVGTTIQVPPIMKKEVLYIPFFGLIGWLGGALIVDRSKGTSRKKIFLKARDRLLNDGVGLQFYPEGTRSKEGRPKKFEDIKKAILSFAYQENIPVYPISLYGTDQVLTRKGKIHFDKSLSAIFHAKLNPKDFENSNDFERACWNKVVTGFDELKKLSN